MSSPMETRIETDEVSEFDHPNSVALSKVKPSSPMKCVISHAMEDMSSDYVYRTFSSASNTTIPDSTSTTTPCQIEQFSGGNTNEEDCLSSFYHHQYQSKFKDDSLIENLDELYDGSEDCDDNEDYDDDEDDCDDLNGMTHSEYMEDIKRKISDQQLQHQKLIEQAREVFRDVTYFSCAVERISHCL
eukprot:gene7213-9676_t